jgi:two-component system sensor histidine kinase AlgZ
MKNAQMVSVFQDAPAAGAGASGVAAPVLDVCQLGLVLRTVVWVECVVGVACMFGAMHFEDWLLRTALVTGGALPATLAWLLVACSLRHRLAALGLGWQSAVAVVLGALAGVLACAMVALSQAGAPAPWLASATAGGLLSAVVVVALVLRARSQGEADAAAQLADLQSRIRPHFLFNTLNSAIALVRAEPDKAELLLEDLSDLFRHALVDQGASVGLEQEIALAQRYLAIERVRFGDRLRVTWQVDPDAGVARVPSLLLQPLVENAVRHGVEPSASGADIGITVQRRRSVVVITVTNTVPAGPGPGGAGVALRNVRERLALLHDVQGQFSSGLKDGVFQVRVEVPL